MANISRAQMLRWIDELGERESKSKTDHVVISDWIMNSINEKKLNLEPSKEGLNSGILTAMTAFLKKQTSVINSAEKFKKFFNEKYIPHIKDPANHVEMRFQVKGARTVQTSKELTNIFNASSAGKLTVIGDHIHLHFAELTGEYLGISTEPNGNYQNMLNPFRKWLLANNITTLEKGKGKNFNLDQVNEVWINYISDQKISKTNLYKFGIKIKGEKSTVTKKGPQKGSQKTIGVLVETAVKKKASSLPDYVVKKAEEKLSSDLPDGYYVGTKASHKDFNESMKTWFDKNTSLTDPTMNEIEKEVDHYLTGITLKNIQNYGLDYWFETPQNGIARAKTYNPFGDNKSNLFNTPVLKDHAKSEFGTGKWEQYVTEPLTDKFGVVIAVKNLKKLGGKLRSWLIKNTLTLNKDIEAEDAQKQINDFNQQITLKNISEYGLEIFEIPPLEYQARKYYDKKTYTFMPNTPEYIALKRRIERRIASAYVRKPNQIKEIHSLKLKNNFIKERKYLSKAKTPEFEHFKKYIKTYDWWIRDESNALWSPFGTRIDNPMYYKGDGGRSIKTRYHETLTCFFLAAYQANKGRPREFFTPRVLNRYRSKVKSSYSVEKILDYLEEHWFYSCWKHAEAFHKKYTNMKSSIEYHHHDSSIEINKLMNQVKKEIRAHGVTAQDDKWNPADAWAVDKKINFDDIAPSKNADKGDILVTNERLRKAFTDRDVMGISLKKLPKDEAKVKEYNLTANEKYEHKVQLPATLRPKKGTDNVFTNNIIEIPYNDGYVLTLQTNDALTVKFDVNVPGRPAGGGNAGFKQFKKLIKKYRINLVSEQRLEEIVDGAKKGNVNDLKQIKQWLDSAKDPKYQHSTEEIQSLLIKADKKAKIKVACFYYFDLVLKNKGLMDDIIILAESKSIWSGPYVKIY